jgi:hypothetical protein
MLTDPFEEPNTYDSQNYLLLRTPIDLTDQVSISKSKSNGKKIVDENFPQVIDRRETKDIKLNNSISGGISTIQNSHQQKTVPIIPNKTHGSNHRWTISTYFSPSYSYHTKGFSELTYYSNQHGAWMWIGEVLAKRKLSKRFSLHTGLSLSPSGQNIENIILLTSSKVNKDMAILMASTTYGRVSLDNQLFGVINPTDISNAPYSVVKNSALDQARLSQRLYYLEIPLVISYSLFAQSTEFEFKLGASAGVLVGNRFILSGNSKKFYGEMEGVNRYNSSLLAGICIATPIGRNINLLLEPSIRLGTKSLVYDSKFTYPFSTSFKVGLSYKLF